MTVTLHALRTAIKTRCAELLTSASTPGPLVSAVSYAGRATRAPLHLAGDLPGVLIWLEREIYSAEKSAGAARSLYKVESTNAESTWVVACIVEANRENEVVADDSASDSLDTVVDAVLAKLAGFYVAGLLNGQSLRLVDSVPLEVEAGGLIVHEIRLKAVRAIAASNSFGEGESPLVIRGNENLLDQTDAATNPVVVFEADPT